MPEAGLTEQRKLLPAGSGRITGCCHLEPVWLCGLLGQCLKERQEGKGLGLGSMSGQGSTSSNRITDDELNALIFQLQTLLPQLNHGRHGRVSATKLLSEICSYIRRLRNEVDDLSQRLSQRLDSMDLTGFDAEIVRNLLQQ
ncbi:hypothetical protein V6N13_086420 [Hibiscus sabdariffa]